MDIQSHIQYFPDIIRNYIYIMKNNEDSYINYWCLQWYYWLLIYITFQFTHAFDGVPASSFDFVMKTVSMLWPAL